MLSEMSKIITILKRDFAMISTYKFAFMTNAISKFFIIFWLILVGRLFGQHSNLLSHYSTNFTNFILIGAMGWSLMWSIIESMVFSIRNEMLMGTMEILLLTPTNISIIVMSFGLFGLVFGMISVFSLFVVGLYVFNTNVFTAANVGTLIIFILSCTNAIAIGFMLSGLIFWQKHLGQFVPFLQGVAVFFSEVYFPLSVLPPPIRPLSRFVPFYYCIKGLRFSLYHTPDIQLVHHVFELIAMNITLFIVGIFSLKKCIKEAKKKGTLSFY